VGIYHRPFARSFLAAAGIVFVPAGNHGRPTGIRQADLADVTAI